MIFKIKKGKHRSWPLRLGIWYDKVIIRRRVTFYNSCKYDLDGFDQEDTNKLFGIAFSNFWRIIWICISWPVFILLNRNRQHEDSARFGWRYNKDTNKLILSAYCYVDGSRFIKDICTALPHKTYILSLSINPEFYTFTVEDRDDHSFLASYSIPKYHNKKWSFPLGFWFGGNRTAPHDMSLNISKA